MQGFVHPIFFHVGSIRLPIKLFERLYGFKRKELAEKTAKALAFAGLTEVKDKKSGEFWCGMKLRMNLACGIAHDPKLIIMDEPTLGIDSQSGNHILENVRTPNEAGVAIFYTTHYMPEVEEICNRITIIDHGRIVTSLFMSFIWMTSFCCSIQLPDRIFISQQKEFLSSSSPIGFH